MLPAATIDPDEFKLTWNPNMSPTAFPLILAPNWVHRPFYSSNTLTYAVSVAFDS